MRYVDQLKRHHPFKIIPPPEFAPTAHRAILEVQSLLRRSGLKKTDPHRIAELFDIHLDALAAHYCGSQKNKSTLLRQGYPPEVRRAVRATKDAQELRRLVPDLDLFKARQFLVPHLLDVPRGIADVPGHIKVGVLALWKLIGVIDVFDRVKSPSRANRQALALVLQAIEAAHFAKLLFESEVNAVEESAEVASAQAQGATDEAREAARIASDRARESGKWRLEYYKKSKSLALTLVQDLDITSLKVAILTLPGALSDRKLGVPESTIRDWFTRYDFKKREYKAKKGEQPAAVKEPGM